MQAPRLSGADLGGVPIVNPPHVEPVGQGGCLVLALHFLVQVFLPRLSVTQRWVARQSSVLTQTVPVSPVPGAMQALPSLKALHDNPVAQPTLVTKLQVSPPMQTPTL